LNMVTIRIVTASQRTAAVNVVRTRLLRNHFIGGNLLPEIGTVTTLMHTHGDDPGRRRRGRGLVHAGDSHYYIAGPLLPAPALAVVDGTGAGAVDQLIATPKIGGVSAHSVAGSIGTYVDGAGGSWNQVFAVPTAGGVNIFSSSTTAPDSDDVSSPTQAQ
jgi:hypothetical protein